MPPVLTGWCLRTLSHWRCLEVGAGGGSIARWLAEHVAPNGTVIATDINTRDLDAGANAVADVRRHDIVNDELEESRFDLVHARLLLEHLPERDHVLQKLVRALRPGGWLVVEDVDYVSGVPIGQHGAHEHEHTQSARLQAFRAAGVDHTFGRRLPERLRALGLMDVTNEGRVWVMEGGSPGARWFRLSLAHLRTRLVGAGMLTDDEIDRMLELFEDPSWSAFSPIIMAAWGRRPDRAHHVRRWTRVGGGVVEGVPRYPGLPRSTRIFVSVATTSLAAWMNGLMNSARMFMLRILENRCFLVVCSCSNTRHVQLHGSPSGHSNTLVGLVALPFGCGSSDTMASSEPPEAVRAGDERLYF